MSDATAAAQPKSPEDPARSVVSGLTDAPIVAEPFPHKVLENTFDSEIFEALAAHFPTPEQLPSKVSQRLDQNYSDRRLSLPLKDYVAVAPQETRAFWRKIESVFYGDAYARAMFATFAPWFLKDLEANYGTRKFRYSIGCELVYDRTGFELKPHTDAGAKAATMLTYVAAPGDPEDLGTVLFEPNDPTVVDTPGTRLFETDGFRVAKQVPYRPNLSVAFPRTGRSFHGVLETTSQRPRRLIQTSLIVAEKAGG